MNIATTKQPGRRFGPAPKPHPQRTIEPLTAQQRRLNYLNQPGRIPHTSLILTPRQYRRLAHKGRGTIVRVWVDEAKRFQARSLEQLPAGLRPDPL